MLVLPWLLTMVIVPLATGKYIEPKENVFYTSRCIPIILPTEPAGPTGESGVTGESGFTGTDVSDSGFTGAWGPSGSDPNLELSPASSPTTSSHDIEENPESWSAAAVLLKSNTPTLTPEPDESTDSDTDDGTETESPEDETERKRRKREIANGEEGRLFLKCRELEEEDNNDKWLIRVVRVIHGLNTDGSCTPSPDHNCSKEAHPGFIIHQCSGREECEVGTGVSVYLDNCKTFSEAVTVEYECVPVSDIIHMCPNEPVPLNAEDAHVLSPNYPEVYPGSTTCSCNIGTNLGSKIMLEIMDFDVETGSSGCEYDWLQFFDTSTVFHMYCGQGLYGNTIKTNSNNATLEFRTDGSMEYKGFWLRLSAHTADGNEDDVEVWCDKSDSNNLPVTEPPSPEEPIMPDEGAKTFDICSNTNTILNPVDGKTSGYMLSTNYPQKYEPQSNCGCNITSQYRHRLEAEIIYFHLEYGENCEFDWLKVRNSSNQHPGSKYCRYWFHHKIISNEGTMNFTLKTDDTVQKNGFLILFKDIPRNEYTPSSPVQIECISKGVNELPGSTTPTTTTVRPPPQPTGDDFTQDICGVHLKGPEYYITPRIHIISPYYPYNYPGNISCACEFETYPTSTLTARFHYFDVEQGYSSCEYDWLKVVNDPSNSFQGQRYCGNQLNGTYIDSVQNKMKLVFKTDAIFNQRGFWTTLTAQTLGGSPSTLTRIHCHVTGQRNRPVTAYPTTTQSTTTTRQTTTSPTTTSPTTTTTRPSSSTKQTTTAMQPSTTTQPTTRSTTSFTSTSRQTTTAKQSTTTNQPTTTTQSAIFTVQSTTNSTPIQLPTIKTSTLSTFIPSTSSSTSSSTISSTTTTSSTTSTTSNSTFPSTSSSTMQPSTNPTSTKSSPSDIISSAGTSDPTTKVPTTPKSPVDGATTVLPGTGSGQQAEQQDQKKTIIYIAVGVAMAIILVIVIVLIVVKCRRKKENDPHPEDLKIPRPYTSLAPSENYYAGTGSSRPHSYMDLKHLKPQSHPQEIMPAGSRPSSIRVPDHIYETIPYDSVIPYDQSSDYQNSTISSVKPIVQSEPNPIQGSNYLVPRSGSPISSDHSYQVLPPTGQSPTPSRHSYLDLASTQHSNPPSESGSMAGGVGGFNLQIPSQPAVLAVKNQGRNVKPAKGKNPKRGQKTPGHYDQIRGSGHYDQTI